MHVHKPCSIPLKFVPFPFHFVLFYPISFEGFLPCSSLHVYILCSIALCSISFLFFPLYSLTNYNDICLAILATSHCLPSHHFSSFFIFFFSIFYHSDLGVACLPPAPVSLLLAAFRFCRFLRHGMRRTSATAAVVASLLWQSSCSGRLQLPLYVATPSSLRLMTRDSFSRVAGCCTWLLSTASPVTLSAAGDSSKAPLFVASSVCRFAPSSTACDTCACSMRCVPATTPGPNPPYNSCCLRDRPLPPPPPDTAVTPTWLVLLIVVVVVFVLMLSCCDNWWLPSRQRNCTTRYDP